LIKMTAQCVRGNRVVNLEQGRFVLGKADQAAEQWSVPVGIISTKAPDQIRYALLDKVSNNFDFAGCDGALKGNAGGVGFFRVWYEPILFTELQREVAKLPKADRVSLVVDTWAMVESGRTPAGAYLDLLSNLRDETSLPVWERVIDTLTLIDRLQQGRPGRERFQKFASALIRPQLQRLGWEEKPEDDPQTVLLRGKVIEALGFFGERDVIDESFRRFEAFRKEPASVAPNLRPAVTHIVGRYSSAEAYAQLHTLAKQAELMEEKRMLYRGMQAALDPDLARQTLAITLTDELSLPDANKLIENVATEGEHPDIAWEFAKANLKELIDRRAFLRRNRFLSAIAEGFSDPEFADELIELTQKHLPDGLPVAERSASLIRHRAELKTGVLPAIDQWIAGRSVDGAAVRR
jgi:aminopeptidase N